MARIKPIYKHKNSGKAKGHKEPEYLNYMHTSGKTCLVCGSEHIELHHCKCREIVGRDDRFVVALCPEHHRGSLCSPHGAPKAFEELYPRMELKRIAKEFYEEYHNGME